MVLMYDSSGAPVTVQDLSRLRVWSQSQERCLFYFAAVIGMLSREKTETRHVLIVSGNPSPVPNLQSESLDLLHTALPFKLKEFVVVQAYDEGRQALIDFSAFQIVKMIKFKTSMDLEYVAAGSNAANLRMLEERGVSRNLIPACLHGNYNYNQFDQWVRSRLSIEEIMSSVPPISNSSLWGNSFQHTSQNNMIVPRPKKRQKRVEVEDRNSLYCKRYYQRSKHKLMNLEDRSKLLLSQNDGLRTQNALLEQLLSQAHSLVFNSYTC